MGAALASQTLDTIRWAKQMFKSGGYHHFANRFCEVVLTQPQFLRWYKSLLQDLLGQMLLDFRYRITRHLYSCTKPNSVGHEIVC